MGAKQSTTERRYNAVPPLERGYSANQFPFGSQDDDLVVQNQRPQMSEAQVQSLLEAQREQYERKLEEVAAREATQRRQEAAAREAAQSRQEVAAREAAQRRQEAAAREAAQSRQEVAAREAAQSRQEVAAREAAQRRQEEAARAAALREQQEEAARAAQNMIERDRPPHSYSANQLQQAAAGPMSPNYYLPVYPNLNQGPMNPNNGQRQYNVPSCSQDDAFVFVNNFGQNQSCNNRPAPSAPAFPRVPSPRERSISSCNNRPAPSAPAPPRGPSTRERSISRNRNTQRERDVLDCPTCHTRFGMKIFQCDSGHSSCNDCKSRGRKCGICRQTLTNRRNFDLENHVAQTKSPCPHKSEGCKLYIKIADMDDHVRECPFKEQDCPVAAVFGTCRWKGKLSEISKHFDNMHPNSCQTNVDSEMQLTNVRNNSQQVHLTVLGVYNFLLHVKVSEADGKVYMAVQLIGTKFGAQKWLYEIHVFNKSENRRKYMYTDNCCSTSDKIEDVFKAGECVVLPVWHANTFVCNGVLTYKFFIKKADEEKRVFGKNQRGRGRGRNH